MNREAWARDPARVAVLGSHLKEGILGESESLESPASQGTARRPLWGMRLAGVTREGGDGVREGLGSHDTDWFHSKTGSHGRASAGPVSRSSAESL